MTQSKRPADIRYLGTFGTLSCLAVSWSFEREVPYMMEGAPFTAACRRVPAIFALGTNRDEALEEFDWLDERLAGFIATGRQRLQLAPEGMWVTVESFRDLLIIRSLDAMDASPDLQFSIAASHAAAVGLQIERGHGLELKHSDELYRCHATHAKWLAGIATSGFTCDQIFEALKKTHPVESTRKKHKAANDSQASLFETGVA